MSVPYVAPRALLIKDGLAPANAPLPYGLQTRHFEQAIEDIYDYFQTVNTILV